jgi:hypothetical protein
MSWNIIAHEFDSVRKRMLEDSPDWRVLLLSSHASRHSSASEAYPGQPAPRHNFGLLVCLIGFASIARNPKY